MKIYTKTGDKGDTSLLGGKRVGKECIEMMAIGEVDELNASLGVLISQLVDSDLKKKLTRVQHKLFVIGGELAAVQTDLVDVPRVSADDVSTLEVLIDELHVDLPALTQFILPGGSAAAAQAFLTRAICRRAERAAVEISRHYELSDTIVEYLNRLSDALFTVGRYINVQRGVNEVVWNK